MTEEITDNGYAIVASEPTMAPFGEKIGNLVFVYANPEMVIYPISYKRPIIRCPVFI